MKTTQTFLAILLVSCSVGTISAQYGNNGYGNGYGRNGGIGQLNQESPSKPKEIPVEVTVAKIIEEMKPAVNLDELQIIAVSNVLTESIRAQGIILKQITNQEDQIKEFQALSEVTDRKIKGFLNKDQIEKYSIFKENKKIQRNQNRKENKRTIPISMKNSIQNYCFCFILVITITSCSLNPYKKSEKVYNNNLNELKETISKKEAIPLQNVVVPEKSVDTLYIKQLLTFKDSISKMGGIPLQNGIITEWIGTVNFNLRKPNFIIIHHTAQDSLKQTLKTFTLAQTQVSAHYVIAQDGRVVHMLNDYLRAWHAGNSSWGRNTDINSASIGIELDNNGTQPFSEPQINSLLALLTKLKKDYNIPAQNIIGHSDIAPSRKQDPSAFFPWKTLAGMGFGIWPDESLETAPCDFDIEQALRIIGYNTKNLPSAISAFKLHYIQTEVNTVLDEKTINTIYSIYKKQ